MENLQFFAFFFLSIFIQISSAFTGPDSIFLSCGSSKSVTVEDRRVFVPDSHFLPYRDLSGSKVEILDGSDNGLVPVHYKTARIFSHPASYKFEIKKKGTHLLRFHFYPFASGSCDLSRARFHVVASRKVILLSDFEVGSGRKMAPSSRGCGFHMGRSSRMDNSDNKTGVEFVLKEYFISVDSPELEITFVPADRSSFAFINAIEVISASTLIPDIVRSMDSNGINKLSGMSKQEYEVLFRINTGGAKITPLNDTMWRNWVPDEDFVNYTANIGMKKIHFSGPIKYTEYGASREIAPGSVYRTARVMKIAKLVDSSVKKNMSWSFSVPSDYNYLVRLHFCDIASMVLNDLYFDIYLNGKIAYEDFDISTSSNLVLATPYYLDFVTHSDSSGRLVITIAASKSSKPSKVNGMLNGLEVMKLNNSAGNLDDEPMTMMMDGSDEGTPHVVLVFVRMFLTSAALFSIGFAGYMLVVRWRTVSHTSAGWSPLPASTPESCISLESSGKTIVQL